MIERDEFERELRAVCAAYGVSVIPYSPLAGGFLTGKYRKDKPLPESVRAKGLRHALIDKNYSLIELMDAIGKAHQATVGQVALAWMLADPVITSPIIGPNTISQLKDNLGALDVLLTTEEKESLDQATRWQKPENE